MAESDSTKLAAAVTITMPRRKPGFIWRKVEGTAVLFNPDSNETYILNQTAAAIWELCDGKHRIEDIANAIIEGFKSEGGRTEILQDIMEFLAGGERNGYILTGKR